MTIILVTKIDSCYITMFVLDLPGRWFICTVDHNILPRHPECHEAYHNKNSAAHGPSLVTPPQLSLLLSAPCNSLVLLSPTTKMVFRP